MIRHGGMFHLSGDVERGLHFQKNVLPQVPFMIVTAHG